MTIVSIFLCDYCAHEIEPSTDWIKLTLASQKRSVSVADYHRQCWHKMEQAIHFAQDAGCGLERIVVASEAAIAELRRLHLPPSDPAA